TELFSYESANVEQLPVQGVTYTSMLEEGKSLPRDDEPVTPLPDDAKHVEAGEARDTTIKASTMATAPVLDVGSHADDMGNDRPPTLFRTGASPVPTDQHDVLQHDAVQHDAEERDATGPFSGGVTDGPGHVETTGQSIAQTGTRPPRRRIEEWSSPPPMPGS